LARYANHAEGFMQNVEAKNMLIDDIAVVAYFSLTEILPF